MDKIKTASGLRFRTEGMVETPLPVAYDANATPGATVLGSDGATYVSKRSVAIGTYQWDKNLTQSGDGTVAVNITNWSTGNLGLVVSGFQAPGTTPSTLLPGRIGIMPGVEPEAPGTGVGQFGLDAEKINSRLEFLSREALTTNNNINRPVRIAVFASAPGWTTDSKPSILAFQVAPLGVPASGIPPRRFEIYPDGSTRINGNSSRQLTVTATGQVQIGNTTGTEQLSVTGNIQLTSTTNSFMVGSNAVVGSRKTGWAAATGTATRSTFDTSTATTAELAERLKALIDDLTTHGLIGA
jgi:hypothetical protein